MSALPFAYAWRWKGGVTWKLTLTKNPNALRGLEIKELFDHSDLAATVIEQQAEIERLRNALSDIAYDAESPQQFYDRNGPQWTSPQGNEYEDTSAHLSKCNELAAAARAVLEGKP